MHLHSLFGLEDTLCAVDPSVKRPYGVSALYVAVRAVSSVWAINLLVGTTPGKCIQDVPSSIRL